MTFDIKQVFLLFQSKAHYENRQTPPKGTVEIITENDLWSKYLLDRAKPVN